MSLIHQMLELLVAERSIRCIREIELYARDRLLLDETIAHLGLANAAQSEAFPAPAHTCRCEAVRDDHLVHLRAMSPTGSPSAAGGCIARFGMREVLTRVRKHP